MKHFLIVVITLVLVQQAIALRLRRRPTTTTPVCPANEVYSTCGSACPRTCDNYESEEQICMAMCVAGCQCATEYVRKAAGEGCCLKTECPAQQNCPANAVYKECGSACPVTCNNYYNQTQVCTDNCVAGCECLPGYVRNDEAGTCCLQSECPAPACPANAVFNTCGSPCPLTCENYMNPPMICTRQCVIGCQCNEGYVKKSDGTCCLKKDC